MNLQKISERLYFYTSSKEMLKSLEQTKMFLSSLFVIRIFNNCKDRHDLNYLFIAVLPCLGNENNKTYIGLDIGLTFPMC